MTARLLATHGGGRPTITTPPAVTVDDGTAAPSPTGRGKKRKQQQQQQRQQQQQLQQQQLQQQQRQQQRQLQLQQRLLQPPANTVDVSQPGKCIFNWPNYKDKTVECVTYDTTGLAADTGTSDTCWAFQCHRTVLACAQRQQPGTQQYARNGPRTDDDINAMALRQCQHLGQPGHKTQRRQRTPSFQR